MARLGELLPAMPPGRGKKNRQPVLQFSRPTITAYRKVAQHKAGIDDYYRAGELLAETVKHKGRVRRARGRYQSQRRSRSRVRR